KAASSASLHAFLVFTESVPERALFACTADPQGHSSIWITRAIGTLHLWMKLWFATRMDNHVSTPSRRTFNSDDAVFRSRWCLIAPVLSGGSVRGVFVFMRRNVSGSSNRNIAKQAQAFAAVFGAIGGTSFPSIGAAEVRAQSLMNLAVELKPSLRLPEFVGRFTLRAAEMLGARAAILALTRGARLETVYSHNAQGQSEWPEVDAALTTLAAESPEPLLLGSAAVL